jgi:hypothetical protein
VTKVLIVYATDYGNEVANLIEAAELPAVE